MTRLLRAVSLVVGILTTAGVAGAQTPAVATERSRTEGWDTIIYPVYAWAPVFGADVRLPDQPNPPSGGYGGSGSGGVTIPSASHLRQLQRRCLRRVPRRTTAVRR